MWFDPGFALLHLEEDINLLVVSHHFFLIKPLLKDFTARSLLTPILRFSVVLHMLRKWMPHINLLLELNVVFFSVARSAKKLTSSTTLPPKNFSPAMILFSMNTFSLTNYLQPFLHLMYHQLHLQLPYPSFLFPYQILLIQTS